MNHRIPLDSVWHITSPTPPRPLDGAQGKGLRAAALKNSRDQKLVRDAIAGSPRAIRRLIARITPVIQARCGRVLARSSYRRGRSIMQQLEDVTQEVFLALFDHDGRELNRWDFARGLSLENFVGIVAHRQTLALLRTGRRNPWYEEPLEDPDLEEADTHQPGPDEVAIRRDLLMRVIHDLDRSLSPQAHLMFQLLLIENRSISEICEMTGSNADAVYAWRSRLLKRVRQLGAELDRDTRPGADEARRATGAKR